MVRRDVVVAGFPHTGHTFGKHALEMSTRTMGSSKYNFLGLMACRLPLRRGGEKEDKECIDLGITAAFLTLRIRAFCHVLRREGSSESPRA
jgi:hypothetical protein